MVGQQALVLLVGVRILLSQPALERQSCCLLWRVHLMALRSQFELQAPNCRSRKCIHLRSAIRARYGAISITTLPRAWPLPT